MAGRPKRVFTEQQIQQIDEMALNNCKDTTIGIVLDIPLMTLKRHFGKRMIKKRAEFKQELRDNQSKLSKTNPAMAIFLGKNELDQVDRQEIKQETIETAALTAEQQIQAQVMSELALRHGPKIRAEIERRGKVKLKGA